MELAAAAAAAAAGGEVTATKQRCQRRRMSTARSIIGHYCHRPSTGRLSRTTGAPARWTPEHTTRHLAGRPGRRPNLLQQPPPPSLPRHSRHPSAAADVFPN